MPTRFEETLNHAETSASFYYLEQGTETCPTCDDVEGYWLSLTETILSATHPLTWDGFNEALHTDNIILERFDTSVDPEVASTFELLPESVPAFVFVCKGEVRVWA